MQKYYKSRKFDWLIELTKAMFAVKLWEEKQTSRIAKEYDKIQLLLQKDCKIINWRGLVNLIVCRVINMLNRF